MKPSKSTWEDDFDALTSKWDGQARASAKAFFRATLHTLEEKIRGMKEKCGMCENQEEHDTIHNRAIDSVLQEIKKLV